MRTDVIAESNVNGRIRRSMSIATAIVKVVPASARDGVAFACQLCCAAMIVVAAACATTAPPPTTRVLDFPSPLEGPGQSQLSRSENDRIERGWRALTSGDPSTARNEAMLAGSAPEATLLGLQAQVVLEVTPAVVEDLSNLTERWSGSASAWITLSVAAERVGNELTALTAARRGADLWPAGPFSGRADILEARWIDDRLENAQEDIDQGDLETALDSLNKVLVLEPESDTALLLQARTLIDLGEGERAEASLAEMGDRPEALLMRAQIAYDDQQWQRSMDLLSRLPEGHTGRQGALRRARLQWRLSILPPYVQEAVESPALTREQLAVLLVATTPALETLSGGRTPLMQDILKLPSQRSILTVTRLGIMSPDPVDNRFHPDRLVTSENVRDAIEAVSHLVGFRMPVWCEPGYSEQAGCTLLQEPMTGRHVTEALLTTVVEEQEA